jgi:hypothetical protein
MENDCDAISLYGHDITIKNTYCSKGNRRPRRGIPQANVKCAIVKNFNVKKGNYSSKGGYRFNN